MKKTVMTPIELSEEELEHFRDWRRLSNDEKEVITKLAKGLASEEKRKSLYSLIEAQAQIQKLVVTAGHVGWAMNMFIKAGTIAGVIMGIYAVIKLAMGWK